MFYMSLSYDGCLEWDFPPGDKTLYPPLCIIVFAVNSSNSAYLDKRPDVMKELPLTPKIS